MRTYILMQDVLAPMRAARACAQNMLKQTELECFGDIQKAWLGFNLFFCVFCGLWFYMWFYMLYVLVYLCFGGLLGFF